MAVVLDALASHVMKMIMDMGDEEIRMLLGVSDEINKLQGNVGPLQNFLTDAERKRITEKSVQSWVTKFKSAMYEATDILDLCQLEAMDPQEKHSSYLCSLKRVLRKKLPFVGCLGDKLKGILQPFLFCVQNPGFAHEVGGRIKKLNQELDNIREAAAKYNFINLGPYEELRRPTSSSAHPRREHAQFIELDLVGDQVKKNTEELVQKLAADHGSSNAVKVVAVVGMGGIGKTSLVKKVFASEAIKEEFKIKIWLSVTQQFAPVDLLRAAITHAGGKHVEEKDETTLMDTLTDALSKKKFPLVLDDVWNQEAWNRVIRDPILNAGATQPGSRVLVTTRKEDVPRRMQASSSLHVNKLGDDDAWCLLKKQLPQPQVGVESDFDELKDIGMKIVKKCDGLPLAIKVMGGLLSTRRPNEHDWETILRKNLGWKEDGSQEELNYSVSLSYDDLSPELKQCFLYYSLFPKGLGFIEDTVISMWISEVMWTWHL